MQTKWNMCHFSQETLDHLERDGWKYEFSMSLDAKLGEDVTCTLYRGKNSYKAMGTSHAKALIKTIRYMRRYYAN